MPFKAFEFSGMKNNFKLLPTFSHKDKEEGGKQVTLSNTLRRNKEFGWRAIDQDRKEWRRGKGYDPINPEGVKTKS